MAKKKNHIKKDIANISEFDAQIYAHTRNFARAELKESEMRKWSVFQTKIFAEILSQLDWKSGGNSNVVEFDNDEFVKAVGWDLSEINAREMSRQLRKELDYMLKNSAIVVQDPVSKKYYEGHLIHEFESSSQTTTITINPKIMVHFQKLYSINAETKVSFLPFYKFSATIEGISISSGTTGSNPLNVILNIIPSNIISTFSVNNAVLGIVFIAVVVGLGMNKLDLGKASTIYRFCDEVSRIIVIFLNYVVTKFGPCAIFMLLCRTFATYGIDYLKPALAYFVICAILLLAYLFIGYPCILAFMCKMNPVVFIRKIFGVIVFGFSTSSSAATLPMNLDVSTKDLGVDSEIASFVLPLGMTINMDGTAIMQVIATLFIAGCGGYDVTVFQLVIIMVLALIASMGTPAAPGTGAVILFTILSGVGFTGDQALIAYSLILAINRPIEMIVTALNCVGDSVAAIAVAKSEGKLNEKTYNNGSL